MLYGIYTTSFAEDDEVYANSFTCLPILQAGEELFVVCDDGWGIQKRYSIYKQNIHGSLWQIVTEAQLPLYREYLINDMLFGSGERFGLLYGFPSNQQWLDRFVWSNDENKPILEY